MQWNKWVLVGSVLVSGLFSNSVESQENNKNGDITFRGLRGSTAETLVRQCKAVENVDLDRMVVPARDAANVGLCLGFIGGVLDLDKVDSVVAKHATRACVPDNASGSQLAKVVVKYANDHPEELNLPAVVVVMYAMEKAFPC